MGHLHTRGYFLVRESEQNPGGFALSIKDYDAERLYHVKHYKIKPLDNNRGFFITTRWDNKHNIKYVSKVKVRVIDGQAYYLDSSRLWSYISSYVCKISIKKYIVNLLPFLVHGVW